MGVGNPSNGCRVLTGNHGKWSYLSINTYLDFDSNDDRVELFIQFSQDDQPLQSQTAQPGTDGEADKKKKILHHLYKLSRQSERDSVCLLQSIRVRNIRISSQIPQHRHGLVYRCWSLSPLA